MPRRLLDLFCGEGGASTGYARAGFDVYGVDVFVRCTQARYPYASHRGDALLVLARLLAGEPVAFGVDELVLADFDAVAGSPPCQTYSITRHSHSVEHPDLLAPTRYLMRATGLPYVIENVPGAPLDNPLTLCGTEFGLTTRDDDGLRLYLRRHRLFESNVLLWGRGGCQCVVYRRRGWLVGGVYGGGSGDRYIATEIRRGGYTPAKATRERLLGIEPDRMTLTGLSQAIPPAYTEHLGSQLLAYLDAEVAS